MIYKPSTLLELACMAVNVVIPGSKYEGRLEGKYILNLEEWHTPRPDGTHVDLYGAILVLENRTPYNKLIRMHELSQFQQRRAKALEFYRWGMLRMMCGELGLDYGKLNNVEAFIWADSDQIDPIMILKDLRSTIELLRGHNL